ncbi:MAG: hypothetical protein HRU82_12945 [Nitrospira sp.]|nr:MAG: hypothetical protein HRU82_12945 [Nitrospira sp.]
MPAPTYLKPDFSDLETCLNYIQQLYQNYGGECSEADLGSILGNKPTSSWFTLKLNSLRAYGFLHLEKDRVRLTELGEMIIRPKDENERSESRILAMRHFPVFHALVNRYQGKSEPAQQYVENVLISEAKVKQDKAKAWASCFLKAARFVDLFDSHQAGRPATGAEPASLPPSSSRKPANVSTESMEPLLSNKEEAEGWLVYPVPVPSGVARIVVPRNLPRSAWEKMKKLLEAIEPENQTDPKP